MAPDIELLLDRPQQILIPLDLEFRMQTALHQDSGSAQVDGLLDLLKDHFLRMNVAFGMTHGPIKSAKAAIFRAEICVINVAVDNIADDPVRMQLAADLISRHPDPNQIVAIVQIDGFRASDHERTPP